MEAGPEPELSDSQYRWDLDGDGFFDDAVGQRIHLSRSLQEFGFVGGQERLVALRVRDIFSCGIATDMVRFIDESAGDLTDDGRVTFDDFLILSQNFGKRDVNQSQGDLNNDDEINFLDFLIMSTNFETDDS